jgi:hypothetical protein
MNKAEVEALAEGMARAQRRMIEYYRTTYGLKPEEALAKAAEPPGEWALEQARERPPQEIGWFQLEEIARTDPEAATEVWGQIKETARDDLTSGQRAARAVQDYFNEGPWELAQFLAIREELSEQWQPQGGMEQLLIDTLAQAYTEQLRWIATGNNYLNRECNRSAVDEEKQQKWMPPRVTEAEAIENAMAMAERWNRVFLRTLRSLRDLRRYAPTVMIQSAGQVNIGQHQVNLSESG